MLLKSLITKFDQWWNILEDCGIEKTFASICIAQCLGLKKSDKPCVYDSKTGALVDTEVIIDNFG
jgi:hypothetical protein